MHMKGWVGHVDYAGVPRELFPLLYVGAHLHLGKGTTWGMGKLAYQDLKDDVMGGFLGGVTGQ